MIGAPDRDHSSGSTLFELLVVLAVIMLLIAVSVPMSKGRAPEAELRVKAQEISALMRLARTVAIRDNREIAVAVTSSGAASSFQAPTAPSSCRRRPGSRS